MCIQRISIDLFIYIEMADLFFSCFLFSLFGFNFAIEIEIEIEIREFIFTVTT